MNLKSLFVSGFTVLATLALTLPSRAAAPADFTVTAPGSGKTFRLADAKGKYVALHFLLKTECPICIRHTRDYAAKEPSLPNVQQVFVKPDSEAEIQKWESHLTSTTVAMPKVPIIYRDPDAKLADAFGIPGGYKFHGQVVHYPALVLLDPDGKEVFRYVGKNNTDRYSFEMLTTKVKELSNNKPQ